MNIEALSPQDALIAVMIATAAADERVSDVELHSIAAMIDMLPIFVGYDGDRLDQVSALVSDLFTEEDGLDALLGLVEDVMPDHLRETAYALACDIAAVDGNVAMTELRMLQELRHELRVGRLAAAAIERGARARAQRLEPRD